MKKTNFAQEFIEVETIVGKCRPLLYKFNIMQTQQKQVLLASNETFTCWSRYSGRGAACHPGCAKLFDKVEVVTVEQVMFWMTPNVGRNDKESTRQQSAAVLAQLYLDKTASTMKPRQS